MVYKNACGYGQKREIKRIPSSDIKQKKNTTGYSRKEALKKSRREINSYYSDLCFNV